MRIKLIFVLSFLVAAVVAGVYWSGVLHREPIPEHLQRMGGDFTLQSADGPVALQDYRGKVVLIYFGYTHCPDACPMTLTNWASAFKQLTDEERTRVKGMLVSVDPARDSVEHLKAYTAYFDSNIVGVTGSVETLEKIVFDYRSEFHNEEADEEGNYLVDHMSFVYVIDPQGKLRELLAHQSQPQDIVKTIRHVLKVAG